MWSRKFNLYVAYGGAYSSSANLSGVIRNEDWCWPAAISETLVRIQAGQTGMELGANDKVILLPTADHNFDCASAYD